MRFTDKTLLDTGCVNRTNRTTFYIDMNQLIFDTTQPALWYCLVFWFHHLHLLSYCLLFHLSFELLLFLFHALCSILLNTESVNTSLISCFSFFSFVYFFAFVWVIIFLEMPIYYCWFQPRRHVTDIYSWSNFLICLGLV